MVCLEDAAEHDCGEPHRWRLVVDRGIGGGPGARPLPPAVARPCCALGRRRQAIAYAEHNIWEGYGRNARIAVS